MKKIHLIFILLVWSGITQAQDYIDLFKFDYAITPPNTFDAAATTTILREMNGELTLPVVINDNVALLTGITYENVSASFAPGRPEENFSGLILKLGANVTHNSKWSGTYMLLPQIASDFKKISNGDFQLGVVALMNYAKTDRFKYRFGLYANTELFGLFIVPVFGFYYLSPAKKFEAKVLMPLSADINYSITQHFRFGAAFKGQIRTYNVNTPVGMETDRYLTKSARDLYAYLQYGMKNGLHFQMAFGRSIGRSYPIYDEKVTLGLPLIYFGDDRTQLNSDFSDSWLFKAGIFYRFKLEKTTAKKR